MIEHHLHTPRQRRHVEVKPASRPGECAYCHRGTVINHKCDTCGTWFPSPLSEISPEKLRNLAGLKKKVQASVYEPQLNGLYDSDPASMTHSLPWD